jgi:hypothetical protein
VPVDGGALYLRVRLTRVLLGYIWHAFRLGLAGLTRAGRWRCALSKDTPHARY